MIVKSYGHIYWVCQKDWTVYEAVAFLIVAKTKTTWGHFNPRIRRHIKWLTLFKYSAGTNVNNGMKCSAFHCDQHTTNKICLLCVDHGRLFTNSSNPKAL